VSHYLIIPEPVVIAGLVVMMALVMVDLVVMPLVVVVMAGPVEMAKPAEYALVLPPVDVVVVLVRYDLEQPKVVDQAVRYLIYATECYCRCILLGNSSHLQWGYLSHFPHSLLSRVAPIVRVNIGMNIGRDRFSLK
jgi:hypothetical protein